MAIQRMDHVGIVVNDLAAATAFFVELGLKLHGEGSVGGDWVDRVVGLEGIQADIAMLEIPGGGGRLELSKFRAPSGGDGDRNAPPNAPGIRISHSRSMTSIPPSPACKLTARSSLERWSATKTSIGSATFAAPRGSSSS